jgi:anti-sigma factor RsiW
MDHEVAIKTHAVERYLLGEMPSSERDAFEEHYFACTECAEEVRSASGLMRDMKTALNEIRPAPKTSSPGWLSWWKPQVMVPAFASLLLAMVVGYQNTVVLPDLKAPRSMSSALILDGTTRGAVPSLHAGDPLRFLTALEGVASGPLRVELDSASGSAVRSGEVEAPAANRPLDVYFPGTLAAGRYQLIVRETPGGKELAHSTFEIVN